MESGVESVVESEVESVVESEYMFFTIEKRGAMLLTVHLRFLFSPVPSLIIITLNLHHPVHRLK